MVSANGINGENVLVMRKCHVSDPVLYLWICRYANEKFEFLNQDTRPCPEDEDGECDCADGVDTPLDL